METSSPTHTSISKNKNEQLPRPLPPLLVTESETHYNVRLPMWSGPMELLLELIRSSELDINNISVAQITEDYLKTLETIKQMNIQVSSDFLVMGATLLLYKTRALLGDTDEWEEDTEHYKETLIQQVLEYEKYRNAAKRFEELIDQAPQLMIEKVAFTERSSRQNPTWVEQTHQATEWVPVPLSDLVAAFYRLTDRKEQNLEADSFHEFYQKVNDKMESITQLLKGPKGLKGIPLSEIARGLMRKHDGKASNPPMLRSDLIASFVAMLELYKLARIEARQSESFKEIYLFSNEAHAVS